MSQYSRSYKVRITGERSRVRKTARALTVLAFGAPLYLSGAAMLLLSVAEAPPVSPQAASFAAGNLQAVDMYPTGRRSRASYLLNLEVQGATYTYRAPQGTVEAAERQLSTGDAVSAWYTRDWGGEHQIWQLARRDKAGKQHILVPFAATSLRARAKQNGTHVLGLFILGGGVLLSLGAWLYLLAMGRLVK